MMSSESALGAQGSQSTLEAIALARRFTATRDALGAFGTTFPSDISGAPLGATFSVPIPRFTQGFPDAIPPRVPVIGTSPSQSGLSSQTDAPRLSSVSERSDHLRSQQLPTNGERNSSRAFSTSRQLGMDDRLPYVALIRGMIDRNQVDAARALLSVAITELPHAPDLLRAAVVLAVPKAARRSIRDVQRTSEYSWLNSHAAAYRGKWVAVVGSELIASATSLKDLLNLLKSSGRENEALIHRIG